HGTVSFIAGAPTAGVVLSQLTYTPAANYHGADTISYTLEGVPYTIDLLITPVNDAPTGSLVVTGELVQGGGLTADTSTLADADGLGTLHYVWERSTSNGGFVAVGSDQPTYTLTAADVGSQIRVQVSYTDGDGTPEQVLSGTTSSVLTANTAPTIISNGGGDTAALSVAENTTAVALVAATDADGAQTLSYAIAGGADAALFTINATTG